MTKAQETQFSSDQLYVE